MRLARVLGAIGRGLISAGVIVLLFVAYQLWGTGIQHQQAQGDLEDDFLELLDSDLAAEAEVLEASFASARTPVEIAAEADDVGEDATAEDDDQAESEVIEDEPEPAPIEVSPELLDLIYPEAGDSLARIVIPAIDVDQITVEGVSVEDLRKGPGHYPSTPNPGMAGNSAIAGHRTTYGAPFHRVDELQPGDEIIVETIQGVFTYRVRGNRDPNNPDGPLLGYFIVTPSDTWVLDQKEGENILTLTACHPKYSARQRIIVQAELVGEPAVTIPRGSDATSGPVELDAGAEDEGRAERAADDPEADDLAQIISDAVAAADDPGVDAEGNPIDESADADDEAADEDAATDDVAESEGGEDDGGGAADDGTSDDGISDGSDTTTDVADGAADTDAGGDSDDASASEPATAGDDGGDPTGEDGIELTVGDTPFGEEVDFGEGLNGDPTKIRPAVMWGLAGGSIWLAAWFIGRRLQRKWTLYIIGLVPFIPALWSCFVNIDQALPSY
ncbi:MAG: class E sortase [Actinomycetota bacterium]